MRWEWILSSTYSDYWSRWKYDRLNSRGEDPVPADWVGLTAGLDSSEKKKHIV